MKTALMILSCCLLHAQYAYSQLNVQLLHQLVSESKSEYTRQHEARGKQVVASANEEVNRSQMGKLQHKYREVQSSFKTVGLAIDATQIGLEAAPVLAEILRQQSIIYTLAADDPILIALAIDAEQDLAGRAKMLINYMLGLAMSIGDINQMKASDRNILFHYVLTELRQIEGLSRGLATSMIQAGRKNALNPFAGFINVDKRLAADIIRKIKVLKN